MNGVASPLQVLRGMEIQIDLDSEKLKLVDVEEVMEVSIVQGCPDTLSPSGDFVSGKWVKDPTNAEFDSKTPWAKDAWGNSYGPYFLPILTSDGRRTGVGIHGTRGPGWSPLVKPPIPYFLLRKFVSDDAAKFSYCSHGCIRVSNPSIVQLFEKTVNQKNISIKIVRSAKN